MPDWSKYKRQEREARKQAGLVRVEVWAHKDDAEEIRRLARELLAKREGA